MIPSWHLSADFQCFLFHYFVVYYLIIRPKLGFVLIAVQMVFVSIFNVIYIEYFQIDTWKPFSNIQIYDLSFFEDSYFASLFYLNAYSIGIIFGWLCVNNVKPKIIDNKLVRISIWSLICFCGWFAFYLPHSYEQTGQKPNKFLKIFWPFYFKLSNCSFYIWAIYSFSCGYSRPLKALFSFKFYIPFSRLSLPLSIIQWSYLHYSLSTTRRIFLFDRLSIMKEIISTFVFSFTFGYLVYLFLEQPINNLLKKLIGLKRKQEVSEENEKSKLN